eukprot:3508377-Prymnesium_polylepis.1
MAMHAFRVPVAPRVPRPVARKHTHADTRDLKFRSKRCKHQLLCKQASLKTASIPLAGNDSVDAPASQTV